MNSLTSLTLNSYEFLEFMGNSLYQKRINFFPYPVVIVSNHGNNDNSDWPALGSLSDN